MRVTAAMNTELMSKQVEVLPSKDQLHVDYIIIVIVFCMGRSKGTIVL